MDSRYTYAVGYIRALENKLLNRRIFQQLAGSGSEEAFLKILESTPYSGAGPGELYSGLAEKSRRLSALVKKLIVEDLLREITELPYDFYNLSALLSAHAVNPDIEPFLHEDRGNISAERLKAAVFDEKYRQLPEYIVSTIEKAKKAAEDFQNPAFAAVVAEKEYFHALDVKCAASKNKFFTDYSSTASDVYNLKTFFRVRRLEAPPEALDAALSERGSISPRVFSGWLKSAGEAAPGEITRSTYEKLAETGENCLQGEKPLPVMDAAGDGVIFELLARADMVVMGPEPVFAYHMKAEHEMKVLRIISAGIQAGAGSDMINERLYLPA